MFYRYEHFMSTSHMGVNCGYSTVGAFFVAAHRNQPEEQARCYKNHQMTVKK